MTYVARLALALDDGASSLAATALVSLLFLNRLTADGSSSSSSSS
jgi:hypothetical protein